MRVEGREIDRATIDDATRLAPTAGDGASRSPLHSEKKSATASL
jgi:hypothetical protein